MLEMKQEIADLPGRQAVFFRGYRLDGLTQEELIRIISWQAHEVLAGFRR